MSVVVGGVLCPYAYRFPFFADIRLVGGVYLRKPCCMQRADGTPSLPLPQHQPVFFFFFFLRVPPLTDGPSETLKYWDAL